MEDHEAAQELGVACHDVMGRVLVALGQGGPAASEFSTACDVRGAGVLCALSALLANGLLHKVEEHLPPSQGYYEVHLLLLLFAFLALARVKSLEQVRYLEPGEWGRLLGLDRIPEVKTLRQRLDLFTSQGKLAAWEQELTAYWMSLDEGLAGILYVDGHVRHYTGSQTTMPRRYSSRNRLCLPSLMDYWVNDERGVPFFVVTAIGNEGMLHYLRSQIIPRLLQDVPNQPTEAELAADPDLHRFTLVFDREGWSPAFFAEIWRDHRIAVQTYQRGRFDPWPRDDFQSTTVSVALGNTTTMDLAERPFVHPACKATADKPEVKLREIRRSCAKSGHQTSIITSVNKGNIEDIATHMFSRWSQENFFKYAAEEFSIDRLAGYTLGETPEDETVKNPVYTKLDADLRRNRAEITKLKTQRGHLTLASNDPQDVADYTTACAPIEQQLDDLQEKREELLTQRRNTQKRIKLTDLPEDKRPRPISPGRWQFLNVIRIIAYRAETALAVLLKNQLPCADEARSLLKDLFTHDADIIVDNQAATLTIRVHHFTNPRASRIIQRILSELNIEETYYPGTKLLMRFELVSKAIPASQEV